MVHRQSETWGFVLLHKAMAVTVMFMLNYKVYRDNTTPKVIIKRPQYILLGPYNTTDVAPVDDVYDQLIDLKNFTFQINPQPCQKYSAGLLLVVIVSSKPSNYENRMTIRRTWGRTLDSTKIVFLLGVSKTKKISLRIRNESETFGDIVQGSFIDAYRNLTYKHVMGLKWVSHHCPGARYILKTDDDVAVNAHGLRKYLARELSPWGAKDMIMCKVLDHISVSRNYTKWVVKPEEFAPQYYPTYCAGYAVIYSQDVVPRLLKSVQSKPYFWIDDVQVTGVAADEIGVARTPLSDLALCESRFSTLMTQGIDAAGKFLIGPPDLNVMEIRQIYKAIKIL